jgi:hypothetical protein
VTEARGPEFAFFEERLSDEPPGLAGQAPADTASGVQSVVLEFCRNELRDDMRVGEPPVL